ncbi:DJ-1/PfpI family protein [Oxalobacteraceae bacterium]|nr:DJ-1/PfpI family protein [Oxalobacteraceae bacterium]
MAEKIAPYQPRFGRAKPVIAVIGENSGTELIDFFIPYGVLARAGVAELLAVSTRSGPMRMSPALRIAPDADIAQFDQRYPDGADYLIVPAVVKADDPALLAWIAAQGAKGATVVSICDGAMVVAASGLLKGHRATAHWATEAQRHAQFPDTRWIANVRYVADGTRISSAGISAALPTTLALVEAIAGQPRAAAVAAELGVAEWSTRHNSDAFQPRLGRNLIAYATTYTDRWFHSPADFGLPLAAGMDEITLAYSADAYARTRRVRVRTLAAALAPLPTLHGLALLPDQLQDGADAPAQRLAAPDLAMPAATALDHTLRAIAASYGKSTAYRIALEFEYAGYQP